MVFKSLQYNDLRSFIPPSSNWNFSRSYRSPRGAKNHEKIDESVVYGKRKSPPEAVVYLGLLFSMLSISIRDRSRRSEICRLRAALL